MFSPSCRRPLHYLEIFEFLVRFGFSEGGLLPCRMGGVSSKAVASIFVPQDCGSFTTIQVVSDQSDLPTSDLRPPTIFGSCDAKADFVLPMHVILLKCSVAAVNSIYCCSQLPPREKLIGNSQEKSDSEDLSHFRTILALKKLFFFIFYSSSTSCPSKVLDEIDLLR